MKEKIAKSMTVTIFILLIFGISLANILTKDKSFSESENRYLQGKPKFTLESLFDGSYTADVEKHKTDQFLLRDEFIGIKTGTEFAIGKKDTNNVYFAKDNYLIERHDEIDRLQLDKNIKFLSEFTNKTAGLLGKLRVSVILVPTASNVLTAKLPPFASDFDQNKLISDVKSAVGTVIFPDIHTVLQSHSDEDIFYKTDHHWTTLGAYYSYQEWCNSAGIQPTTNYTIDAVSTDFFGTIYSKARLASTKPDTIHRYVPNFPTAYTVEYNQGERTEDTLYAPEYLQKRDQYSYFLRGNNPIVQVTSQNKNGKKLLLIKDSYAHSIAPFIVNDFEEVFMVDLRYLNYPMSEYITENGITDVVFLYNTVGFAKDLNLAKLSR